MHFPSGDKIFLNETNGSAHITGVYCVHKLNV